MAEDPPKDAMAVDEQSAPVDSAVRVDGAVDDPNELEPTADSRLTRAALAAARKEEIFQQSLTNLKNEPDDDDLSDLSSLAGDDTHNQRDHHDHASSSTSAATTAATVPQAAMQATEDVKPAVSTRPSIFQQMSPDERAAQKERLKAAASGSPDVESSRSRSTTPLPPPSFIDQNLSDTDSDSSSDEDSDGEPKPPKPPRFDKNGIRKPTPAYYYDAEYDPASASSSKRRIRRGGAKGVPVFTPTMEEFTAHGGFYGFVKRIEKYGLRSGIVKVIPPKEWSDKLPSVSEPLRKVRLREPIEQRVVGGQGLYRIYNVAHGGVTKEWNAAQWKSDIAMKNVATIPDFFKKARAHNVKEEDDGDEAGDEQEESPAKKKRRDEYELLEQTPSSFSRSKPSTSKTHEPVAPKKPVAPSTTSSDDKMETDQPPSPPAAVPAPPVARSGDASDESMDLVQELLDAAEADKGAQQPAIVIKAEETEGMLGVESAATALPPADAGGVVDGTAAQGVGTGLIQLVNAESSSPIKAEEVDAAVKGEEGDELSPLKNGKKQSKLSKRAAASEVTDEEWAEFMSHFDELPGGVNKDAYTVEVVREIERMYWRRIGTDKPAWYGADMKGSIFTDETEHWNVARLGDLLADLVPRGVTIPGVVSPYLYFGMWRATFAWHVEDADLYSINYIHYGAPKFWYSVPQASAERFESCMAGNFSLERNNCPQFMRHKQYLASPKLLAQSGITLNRVLQLPGEFILTYPKGYHSGFNLGNNCAESINFATQKWIPVGRNSKNCKCVDHSVTIDVDAWLREASLAEKDAKDAKEGKPPRKMRRQSSALPGEPRVPKPKPVKQEVEPKLSKKEQKELEARQKEASFVCCLCPDLSIDGLVDVGEPNVKQKGPIKRAHRLCVMFTPATWVEYDEASGKEMVRGFANIEKARWKLKCQLCPEKHGTKVQCTKGKCPKAVHVTCALAAGSGFFIDARVADEVETGKTVSLIKSTQEEGSSMLDARAPDNAMAQPKPLPPPPPPQPAVIPPSAITPAPVLATPSVDAATAATPTPAPAEGAAAQQAVTVAPTLAAVATQAIEVPTAAVLPAPAAAPVEFAPQAMPAVASQPAIAAPQPVVEPVAPAQPEPTTETAAEEHFVPITLTVLCRTHNPEWVRQEALRKKAALAAKVSAIPIGARIRVKTSGGAFDVTLAAHMPDREMIQAIYDDGKRQYFMFKHVLWPDSPEEIARRKQEAEREKARAESVYVYDQKNVVKPTQRAAAAQVASSQAQAAALAYGNSYQGYGGNPWPQGPNSWAYPPPAAYPPGGYPPHHIGYAQQQQQAGQSNPQQNGSASQPQHPPPPPGYNYPYGHGYPYAHPYYGPHRPPFPPQPSPYGAAGGPPAASTSTAGQAAPSSSPRPAPSPAQGQSPAAGASQQGSPSATHGQPPRPPSGYGSFPGGYNYPPYAGPPPPYQQQQQHRGPMPGPMPGHAGGSSSPSAGAWPGTGRTSPVVQGQAHQAYYQQARPPSAPAPAAAAPTAAPPLPPASSTPIDLNHLPPLPPTSSLPGLKGMFTSPPKAAASLPSSNGNSAPPPLSETSAPSAMPAQPQAAVAELNGAGPGLAPQPAPPLLSVEQSNPSAVGESEQVGGPHLDTTS